MVDPGGKQPDVDLDGRRRAESLCDEFEQRWQSGERPNLEEYLALVPDDQQGRVSGLAIFASEIVLLVTSSIVGAMSDRIGRRGVFVAGVILLGLGYVMFAYVDDVTTLVAVRVFLALGITVVNVMVGALMADYPAEIARGKLVAAAGIAIGVGNILIGVVFLRLPQFFAASLEGRLQAFINGVNKPGSGFNEGTHEYDLKKNQEQGNPGSFQYKNRGYFLIGQMGMKTHNRNIK